MAWEEYAAGQLPSATDFNVWGLDAVHGSAISGSIDGSIRETSAEVSRRHAGRLLRRSFRRNREAQHGNVRGRAECIQRSHFGEEGQHRRRREGGRKCTNKAPDKTPK